MEQASGAALPSKAVAVMVAYHVLSAGKEEEMVEAAGVEKVEPGHDVARAVYDLVQRKLAGDRASRAALEALREQPTSESRRESLAAAIASHAEDDPAFSDALAKVVEEATANTGVTQTILTIYGYDQAQSIGIL
jgi:hypothetical protein